MSSPPNAPALLPSGRMKWLWLAIAGALGLWLLVLLVSRSDRAPARADSAESPAKSAQTRNPTFDSPAAEVFTQRHQVKATRQLPAFPVVPDQRKRE